MPDTSAPAPRVAGKLGRQPVLPPVERLPIPWFHEIFAAAATPATYPLDVTAGRQVTWLMLGNGPDPTLTVTIPGQPDLSQGCGDCFFAGVGHDEILAEALAGGTVTVNADGTVTLYFHFDNNQDLGVVIAKALLWCYQQGIIEGFAPVHPDNVDSVMQITGRGVLLGVNLTPADQGNFEQSPPVTWEVTADNQPDPDMGHVVYKIKSTSFGGDGTIVTWGDEQPVGSSWLATQPAGTVEEAWVILTAVDKANLPEGEWNALVAVLDALPGATPPAQPAAPVPAAPVAPGPPPAPPDEPPPPAHQLWWDAITRWYEDAVRWVESQ